MRLRAIVLLRLAWVRQLLITSRIAKAFGGRRGSQILDLGCEDGKRTIALARHTFNCVTGLDASERLIDEAKQKATKRGVNAGFVCGDPCATPFASDAFDEVMVLGDLFGHFPTARSDVDLLREVNRVLKPGGQLHLSFSDGGWIRRSVRSDTTEGVATGYIYRHSTLSDNGHSLRTVVVRSDRKRCTVQRQNTTEWLYTPREVADLLHRLQFDTINLDDVTGTHLRISQAGRPPKFIIRCRSSRYIRPPKVASRE